MIKVIFFFIIIYKFGIMYMIGWDTMEISELNNLYSDFKKRINELWVLL